jgi:hypothetical protein
LKIAWKHLIRDIPFSCQGKSNIFFFTRNKFLFFTPIFTICFFEICTVRFFLHLSGQKCGKKNPYLPILKINGRFKDQNLFTSTVYIFDRNLRCVMLPLIFNSSGSFESDYVEIWIWETVSLYRLGIIELCTKHRMFGKQ